nr:RsfA family transcriptional regulator [Bacillus sp. FJAT-44742]
MNMEAARQDAWNEDEDLILAEVVLRHIREGSTQLAAFEEVGEKLKRTAAACGFRWNAAIRKKYESAIALAKKHRQEPASEIQDSNYIPAELEMATESHVATEERKSITNQGFSEKSMVETEKKALDMPQIIEFLHSLHKEEQSNESWKEKYSAIEEKAEELEREKKAYQRQLLSLQEKYDKLRSDYEIFMDIMDRAKELTSDHPVKNFPYAEREG